MSLRRLNCIKFLVIIAFLAKGIFSAGFVPSANAKSHTLIEICTSQGITQILVDGDNAPNQKTTHKSDCPFCFNIKDKPVLDAQALSFVVSAAALKIEFYTIQNAYTYPYKNWDAQAPPFIS